MSLSSCTRALAVPAWVLAAVCLMGLDAGGPRPTPTNNRADSEPSWVFAPGEGELARYYEWIESGASINDVERMRRIESLLEKGGYFEAFLWATTRTGPIESPDPMSRRVLQAVEAALERWESALGGSAEPGDWKTRAHAHADRLGLFFGESPAAAAADLPEGVSPDRGVELAEILLVEALDHVRHARIGRLLHYQYLLDPSAERFHRWRARAHATRMNEAFLAYLEANAATLPYPEAAEDLAIERMRRHRAEEAYRFYSLLCDRFPERGVRHVVAIRSAYKARLAALCESRRYDEALRHIEDVEVFPFEVLDHDMATHVVFQILMEREDDQTNGDSEALLKFLMNHSLFSKASYVTQALEDRKVELRLPSAYRAIVETQLGNAGMAYRLLESAVRTEPPSAAFFFALGLATERFKHLHTLAERVYEQSLLLDPEYDPSILALARHAAMRGDFEKALELAESVRERHPENDLARYETARVLYIRGELDQAESLFLQLADGPRARPDYFLFLVQIALKRGDSEAGRARAKTLLRWFPSNLRGYVLLADCERLAGRTDREIEALESALARARPWRYERLESARMYRLVADRLARLDVVYDCRPRFELLSHSPAGPAPRFVGREQSPAPWTLLERERSIRVKARRPPRWVAFDPDWSRIEAPLVWRDPVGATAAAAQTTNNLRLENPSDHEMIGVRVFADEQEFAFIYRLLPRSRLSMTFRTPERPRQISLLYHTETGFVRTVLPAGRFVP